MNQECTGDLSHMKLNGKPQKTAAGDDGSLFPHDSSSTASQKSLQGNKRQKINK